MTILCHILSFFLCSAHVCIPSVCSLSSFVYISVIAGCFSLLMHLFLVWIIILKVLLNISFVVRFSTATTCDNMKMLTIVFHWQNTVIFIVYTLCIFLIKSNNILNFHILTCYNMSHLCHISQNYICSKLNIF